MIDRDAVKNGSEPSFPGKRLDFFLGSLGSRELIEIPAPKFAVSPDGSIGLSVGWLAELVKNTNDPNAVIWLRGDIDAPSEASQKANHRITLASGGVEIDYEAQEVLIEGVIQHTTPLQFGILGVLAKKTGTVFTREALLREVWGYDAHLGSKKIVDVHVAGIRKKVLGKYRDLLKTRRGAGYVLSDLPKRAD